MHNRRSDKWTLDKRVPVISVILLCIQCFGLIWYASKIDSRVSVLEEHDRALTAKNDPLVERVIKMEVTMTGMGKQLDSISDKLDKRLESRR